MEDLNKYNAILYKKGSLGRIKEWSIRVYTDPKGRLFEETLNGYMGGRMKLSSKPTTDKGVQKAQTKVEKKLREGYVKTIDEAKAAGVTLSGMQAKFMTIQEVNRLEMRKLVDEKFNGVRGTYHYSTDTILSKGNKEWNVKHIHDELQELCEQTGLQVVDFEFYAHGYKVNEIQSMVKNPANEDREKLKAFIFDALESPDSLETALHRKVNLHRCLKQFNGKHLVEVSYYFIKDAYQLVSIYEQVIARGGEGVVVRDADAPYDFDNKSRRSTKMIKVKPLYTKEFLAVGCSFEKRKVNGEWRNLIIYTCKTPEGKAFDVTPEGDVDSRCIEVPIFGPDSWYVVEFREYTTNGIPFHGVGKGFRDSWDVDTESSDELEEDY